MRFTDCIDITGESCKKFVGKKIYISTGAVDVDYVDLNQIETVNYDTKPSRANLITDDNSILFAKMQGTKKVLFIDKGLEKKLYSTGFFSVAPKKNILNKKCLFHLLGSKTFLSQKDKYCSGATQKSITLEGLNKIEITIPNLEDQDKIVKILDSIKVTIESYKKEIKKYDELIKARFIEMFGDVRENSNEFEIVQFNDIVEYMGDIGSNGANKVVVNHLDMKDEEDYAIMVRFTNFTKNDFKNDVKYISKDAYDFFKKSQIFGGELIVCKIGSAGQNYVMPYLNRPVSLGLNQIMIRIKDTILMPYLYQYLHTDYGEFLISGCINGAVTKTITKTELKKIPILLPPMEFQQEFADFVEQVDKSREAVKKSLEKTQQLYDSLMQEYFG